MSAELLKLPVRLQVRVNSELKPGEIVDWIGQPNSTKYMLSGFVYWLFFIPWTAIAVFVTAAIVDFKNPDFSNASRLIPLCITIPFIIIGIAGLCAPIWLKRRSKDIVYVITNLRAFTIEGSRSYLIRSSSPFQLTRITRRENADGSGNLMFLAYPDEKDDSGVSVIGFYNIPQVKYVARIIENLAENRPAPDSRYSPYSSATVSYNEEGITLSSMGSENKKVFWGEIDLISIHIEKDFLPFPYWYVGNQNNRLCIPNDANGGKELFLDGFSEFIPGYRSEATFKTIIEAFMAMEGTFTVWSLEES